MKWEEQARLSRLISSFQPTPSLDETKRDAKKAAVNRAKVLGPANRIRTVTS
jgi:hypothetical protein